MSPRQRNRRREKRQIVRIDRIDVMLYGRVIEFFPIPTFRGARYDARARQRLPPIPPMVTWFQERWSRGPIGEGA